MKLQILTMFAMAATIRALFGQGQTYSGSNDWRRYRSPYDIKTRPPIEFSQAWEMALARIGPETNRYFFLQASCIERTRGSLPGWSFALAETNGLPGLVEISFDKEVYSVLIPEAEANSARDSSSLPKNRPVRAPVQLQTAYARALQKIGDATNKFYCVSLSSLDVTNDNNAVWTFAFSNTNGERGRVNVLVNGEAVVVARQGEILIKN